jgi:FecR protein
VLERYEHKKWILVLGLFFIVSFALYPMTYGRAAEPIGKFTYLGGRVDILRGGALPALFVKVGDPVFVKDVIRTKSNSRAEVLFTDGNVLKLSQKSRVDISEYITDESKKREIIQLKRGNVEAVVDKDTVDRIKVSPKANQFEIHTPFAVAGVRGTVYSVYQMRNATIIFVLKGVVYVYNPKFPDKIVVVKAGQMTRVYEDRPPLRPRGTTEEEKKRFERIGWIEDPTLNVGDLAIRTTPSGPGIPTTPPVTETYPALVTPKPRGSQPPGQQSTGTAFGNR